jgi:hypothetical protein
MRFHSPDDRTSVVGQLAPDVVTSRFAEFVHNQATPHRLDLTGHVTSPRSTPNWQRSAKLLSGEIDEHPLLAAACAPACRLRRELRWDVPPKKNKKKQKKKHPLDTEFLVLKIQMLE